jgi:hypothetical protein
MKLKFYARKGNLCPWPQGRNPGQPRRYIGRVFTPGDGKTSAAVHAASKEPEEIDSGALSPVEFEYVQKKARGEAEIWPADTATAAALGVEFTQVTLDADGEWIAGALAKAQPAPKKVASES